MKPHRLPAFTLFEVLLAMAIATIIIGLVFRGLGSIQQQLSLYQERAEFLASANRGLSLIQHDFDRARRVEATTNKLYLFSSRLDIVYEFQTDYFLRQYALAASKQSGNEKNSVLEETDFPAPINKDTFPLPTTGIRGYFNYIPVAGRGLNTASEPQLIDHFHWEFKLVEQARQFNLRKEYATLEFISD